MKFQTVITFKFTGVILTSSGGEKESKKMKCIRTASWLADNRVDSVSGSSRQTGVSTAEGCGGEGDTQCWGLGVRELLWALLHGKVLTGGVGGGHGQ